MVVAGKVSIAILEAGYIRPSGDSRRLSLALIFPPAMKQNYDRADAPVISTLTLQSRSAETGRSHEASRLPCGWNHRLPSLNARLGVQPALSRRFHNRRRRAH